MARVGESAEIIAIGKNWSMLQALLDKGGLTQTQIGIIENNQRLMHEEAERLRALAGYSGGDTGSEMIMLPTNGGGGIVIDGGVIPNMDNVPNVGVILAILGVSFVLAKIVKAVF